MTKSNPNDLALAQALAGASFGPNASLTLPSGMTLNADQAQQLADTAAAVTPGRRRKQTKLQGLGSRAMRDREGSVEMVSVTVLRFLPPTRPLSMNERLHWSAARRRTRPWRDAAWAVARSAGRWQQEPIVVTVRLPLEGNRRRDPHNYAPTMKAVVDGLVLAEVVPDDSAEWVATTEPVLVDAAVEPQASIEIRPRS